MLSGLIPVFKSLLRLLDPLTRYYLENLNIDMAIYHHELKKAIKTVVHLFDRVTAWGNEKRVAV